MTWIKLLNYHALNYYVLFYYQERNIFNAPEGHLSMIFIISRASLGLHQSKVYAQHQRPWASQKYILQILSIAPGTNALLFHYFDILSFSLIITYDFISFEFINYFLSCSAIIFSRSSFKLLETSIASCSKRIFLLTRH